jgi:tetratricopeptide (TPR) repeat protein
MSLIPGSTPKTFNLLSIGHRGVGKTVFLAGSYTELNSGPTVGRSRWWFECQDKQSQESIEKLLSYVARTGQYPPPTMKSSNFSFRVKGRRPWGDATLCYMRWWDIPGEICSFQNPDFQRILLTSHGCCVFVSAKSLIHDYRNYGPVLEQTIKQVETIGSIVNQSGLQYLFAIVLTQCDLLETGSLAALQVEEKLQPFTARLDTLNITYQKFYSGIPIVKGPNGATLGTSGAGAPLLWIATELRRMHNFKAQVDLASGVKRVLSPSPTSSPARRKTSTTTSSSNWLLYGLAGLSLMGVITALLTSIWVLKPFAPSVANLPLASEQEIKKYQDVLQRDPTNRNALQSLAGIYLGAEQYDQAIPFLEKLVQADPANQENRFQLAQIYELAGRRKDEEAVYDQILMKDQSNVVALTKKAVLRTEQGETEEAKQLFARAEKAAPNADVKAQVRAIADSALKTAAQSKTP